MRAGTPASRGCCDKAKTACSFTSRSRSASSTRSVSSLVAASPAASHIGAKRMYPAGPHGERNAYRSRLAIVLDLIVVEAVVERGRAPPSPPPALPAGAFEGDDVTPIPAHPGTGGEAQPDRAVRCARDSSAEALGDRGPRHEHP